MAANILSSLQPLQHAGQSVTPLTPAPKGYISPQPITITCGNIRARIDGSEDLADDLIDILVKVEEVKRLGFGTVSVVYRDGKLQTLRKEDTTDVQAARKARKSVGVG